MYRLLVKCALCEIMKLRPSESMKTESLIWLNEAWYKVSKKVQRKMIIKMAKKATKIKFNI